MTRAEREAHEARCATLRAAGLSLAELRAWADETRATLRAIEAVADAYERDPATLPPLPAGPLADTLPPAPPDPAGAPPDPRTTPMSIIDRLPPRACAERDAVFLDAARAGALDPITWAPVVSERDGHLLVVYVTADALTLEGVRFTVTHRTAQRIADLLGGHLLTSRIADLAYLQATARLAPQIGGHGCDMSHTWRMVEHSAAVDAAVARAGVPAGSLVCDVGKDWVNTTRLRGHPDRAANFGWHAPAAPLRSPGGVPLWQSVGLAHNVAHVDYSQVTRLVRADAELDGVVRPLAEIARDPALWRLVSDEGPVELRHPGVPAEVATC